MNGSKVTGTNGSVNINYGVYLSKLSRWNNYWYIDELRISSGTLYTNTYTPSAQPFDTNKVMVLPEDGSRGEIAVKSNVPVTSLRVGGVRPTYPTTGDVFVNVEKTGQQHKVESVQQYQTSGWVAVDAVIYDDGWKNIDNYNLRTYTIDETDFPDDGDGDDSSSSGGTLPPQEDGESFWQWLGRVLGDFFGGILDFIVGIVKKLIGGILDIIDGLFSALKSLLDFATGFGDFIAAAFYFLPPEITAVIVAGLSLAIILMIIKFIRG